MRIDRVNFAAAMARADLNVKRLAELSGLSRGTITSVKTGKSVEQITRKKFYVYSAVPCPWRTSSGRDRAMYFAIMLAGAYQLTRWVMALVERIERS